MTSANGFSLTTCDDAVVILMPLHTVTTNLRRQITTRHCYLVSHVNTVLFLPARRYASAGNSDRNVSICLSVLLSVTRRYSVKTRKASGMISSPSGSPKTLVFWRQISSPNFKGFPLTGASNKGRSEKFSDFLALTVNISKTVADTAKVTVND